MGKRFYLTTRDLHLYLGLFISPLVLVFSISVIFLAHKGMLGTGAAAKSSTVTGLAIPPGFEQLRGREQIDAAQALLSSIGVRGEIFNLRQIPRERRFAMTVNVPGVETVVDLTLANNTAAIARRTTGVWDAMVYLHKTPGPHLVVIRGNAAFMQVWRWLADATVYLILFISVSGVYLWAMLKAERRTGLALLAVGALSFGGLVYALVG